MENESTKLKIKGTKTLNVRLTFTEPILGTLPADTNVFQSYIGSKAPDADNLEDEIAAIGVDAAVDKKTTIFPKDENGNPFVYDYQIKGFFKGACSFLKRVPNSESYDLKAHKKVIDGDIFVLPKKIPFENFGGISFCERPLRGQTPQGETVSLARSEEIREGSTITFQILILNPAHEKCVREWLDYGVLSGIGQWRNSGKGRFVWEELDSPDADSAKE